MEELSESFVPAELHDQVNTWQVKTWNIGGVQVSTRCHLVSGSHPRFELLLQAEGVSAIVDLPCLGEDELAMRIEQAADCFAATLRARSTPR